MNNMMTKIEYPVRHSLIILIVVALCSINAYGADPDEILSNTQLEERARQISRNLRCVVCQSQSIDDSDAPLAKDMRILVRERLVAGDTNQQIYAFMVERYGDYVLLKPPVQQNTLILWLAPVLLLTGGALGYIFYFRQMGVQHQDIIPEEDNKKIPISILRKIFK